MQYFRILGENRAQDRVKLGRKHTKVLYIMFIYFINVYVKGVDFLGFSKSVLILRCLADA